VLAEFKSNTKEIDKLFLLLMKKEEKFYKDKIEDEKETSDKNERLSYARLIEVSRDNLTRILSFFPRVDVLSSVILAIDISMMAVLAANTPALRSISRFQTVMAILFLFFVGVSLYNLYKCAFPRLECEEKSLIYFQEIAKLEQLEFAKEFLGQTEKDYLHDLIKQVWRNSEILQLKFKHLKSAFRLLVLALIPWVISLLYFASENKQSFLSK
jgi:hypothetical protein